MIISLDFDFDLLHFKNEIVQGYPSKFLCKRVEKGRDKLNHTYTERILIIALIPIIDKSSNNPLKSPKNGRQGKKHQGQNS